MNQPKKLCFPLKIGTIFFSIFEFIVAVIGFLVCSGALIYFEQNQDDLLELFASPPENLQCLEKFINFDNLGTTSIRITLILSMTYGFQRSALSVLLIRAVFKEQSINCQVWIVYSIILLTCSCAGYMTAILFGLFGLMSIPIYVALFCIQEYSICIVSAYEKQFGNSVYEKTMTNW